MNSGDKADLIALAMFFLWTVIVLATLTTGYIMTKDCAVLW